MKQRIGTVITAIIAIALSVLGFVFGAPSFTQTQQETMLILLIVFGCAVAYCFIVGEISRNNSQMDKLWSITPIAYVWIIAAKGNMNPRLAIFAVIVTLWGIRLTINFARKGAYSIKFWQGEEDYRWKILREKKPFQNKIVWALFDLFFISFYQNLLVLAICLPALACMSSDAPLGAFDFIATFAATGFLMIETAADEQQMSFYTTRKNLLAGGKKLEDIPAPYNKGFNTTGLFAYCRHPNYLGEQGIWISLYVFVIGSGVANYGIFNWSLIGPMFLILLFIGSSSLGEKISNGKYPEYQYYLKQVNKYLPLRKYKGPEISQ